VIKIIYSQQIEFIKTGDTFGDTTAMWKTPICVPVKGHRTQTGTQLKPLKIFILCPACVPCLCPRPIKDTTTPGVYNTPECVLGCLMVERVSIV
jgi:hypothetical protein